MKTDALFYQLFQTLPDLFFELAGMAYSESYQFQAVELKQTAFRLDKLPHLPREEILKMINLSHVDITRTLLYQDAKQEGRQEGRREEGKSMLMRLLTKRFGNLKAAVCKKIEQLSIEELEQLADDFLGVDTVEDLGRWLGDRLG